MVDPHQTRFMDGEGGLGWWRTYEYVRLTQIAETRSQNNFHNPDRETPHVQILPSFPDAPCGSFDVTPRTLTRVPVWTLTWSMLLWSSTKNWNPNEGGTMSDLKDYLGAVVEHQDPNGLVTWADVARDIEDWIEYIVG